MQPYIGVTGFLCRAEVDEALSVLNLIERAKGPLTRKLMIGVLACSADMAQKPNRWKHRYPNDSELGGLFPPDRRTLNLIHFNSDHANTLTVDLPRLIERGGAYIDGIQLNIPWPTPSKVHGYGKAVTLELGRIALESCGHDPKEICYRLEAYGREVKRVLIDTSAGRGIPLVLPYLKRLLEPIAERFPELGVGIAGGISLERLDEIRPLVETIPRLSIDAEGALRTPDDLLDSQKMRSYLERAFTLYA